MIRRIKIIVIIMVLMQNVFAQNVALDNDSLLKKNISPTEIEMVDKRQPIIYNVASQDLTLDYKAFPIKPLSFQPSQKGKNNWLKVGMGNLNNRQLLGTAIVPFGKNSLQILGGFSSAKATDLQAHQHLIADVNYLHTTVGNNTSIGALFTANNQNKYGNDGINNGSQNFYIVKIRGSWHPKYTKAKYNIFVNTFANYLKTNSGSSEVTANIHWQHTTIMHKGEFNMACIAQYNNMYNTDSNLDVSFVKPTFEYKVDNLITNFNIGLSGAISRYNVYPLPFIELRQKLFSTSIFHASFKSQLLQTNLQDILMQNPFANYDIKNFEIGRLYRSSIGYTIGAGKLHTLNVNVAYNNYDNAIRYNTIVGASDSFIATDFISTSSMQYQFGWLYHATQDLQIGLDGSFQSFIEEPIYHMPTTELSAYSHIQLTQKIFLKINYVFRNGMLYKPNPILSNVNKLSAISDLHTELNWRMGKRIGIYGQLNNILNQQNQAWYAYNSYKRNFVIGLQWQ